MARKKRKATTQKKPKNSPKKQKERTKMEGDEAMKEDETKEEVITNTTIAPMTNEKVDSTKTSDSINDDDVKPKEAETKEEKDKTNTVESKEQKQESRSLKQTMLNMFKGQPSDEKTLKKKYTASMILSGVGDAMGYKNGSWEFCRNVSYILEEIENLGGIMNITLNPKDFMVSDDTVMHIATAEGLLTEWNGDKKKLYEEICKAYVECWKDMGGRGPGIQCGQAMPYLKRGAWTAVPFSPSGGGCGAAMRTMCIGLYFYKPEQLRDLIEVSIESSRMTHNHPTGFFGGLAAALFTSYALQNVPLNNWGYKLVNEVIPEAKKYLEESARDFEKYQEQDHLVYFEAAWRNYITLRGIEKLDREPEFPSNYSWEAREKFYKKISFSGWGGSSGHDSVLIAYDAILGCEGSWEEFCKRGIIHGGDNDSTGAIGGAWFGALWGYKGVPKNHWDNLEYKDRLIKLSNQLYKKAHQ